MPSRELKETGTTADSVLKDEEIEEIEDSDVDTEIQALEVYVIQFISSQPLHCKQGL